MSRTIEISLPAEKADNLIRDLREADGIVGFALQRAASLKPPGDVLTVHTTNEGFLKLLALLPNHKLGPEASILTSEPQSLVSDTSQRHIDSETNEASWPEMAALLHRETNVSSNYLMAMFCAGLIAAVGLWTETVHIVVGAMVIAPGFEPIIRVPFGLLGRQREAWRQGLSSTGLGYLALIAGAAAAVLVLSATQPSSGTIGSRDWVQYWSSIQFSSVLVALAAGAAGAAIIAAQRSVLTAGVMIALALVPSAAIVGMALAAGDVPLAARGLLRWAVDAACVVVAGGLVFLLKRNQSRRQEESIRASAPI